MNGVLISGLTAIGILMLFFYVKNKKESELNNRKKWGRKGRKSHIWQILKEYHKKKGKQGFTIECFFIFERPSDKRMYDALKKGYLYRYKENNKSRKKLSIPDYFEEEEYFKELATETMNLNKTYEFLRKYRRRYVILYKLKKNEELSGWNAIEAEILKKSTNTGKFKQVVVINKELDLEKEMLWIEPMLDKQLKDKERAEKEKSTIRAKIKRFFS